ncbi:putative serine esterase-domain-containing protein [Scenedesmus sp. NREL 46B-D3]|nr:putative serine esterase-domain-containing protein [Scenedesmus sp. NREL 46B-D3]
MKLKGTRDARAVHLVVLQHGLWGRPDDVARLAAFLQAAFHAADAQQQLQDRIVVLNSTCNARVLTYDGIDVCGARLAKLVQETVEEQQQEGARVIKLSLIGYSLGGLICRYAAGKLHVAGLFEEVQPANLITIATPHLGSFKEPTTWMARFFNVNVPLVASRTGMQLVLADADYSVPWLVHQQQLHNQAHQQRQQQQQHGQQRQQQGVVKQQHAAAAAGVSTDSNHHQQQHQQQEGTSKADDGAAAASQQQPGGSSGRQQQQQQQQQPISLPPGVDPSQPVPLLLLMAHPAGPFHQALAAFKTRICCANIRHDTTVPYCTAGICTANPYEQRPPVSVNPQLYPSVVQPAGEGEQHAAFPDAKGRSRMLLFLLFLPLFPLFYGYSVSKGLLHHREARKRPVDVAWLQQYQAAAEALGAGLNPFSRQASRQLQERLEQQQEQQQQQQQQQHQQQKQQHVPRAGEGGSSAAVVTPVLSSALAPSPFAAAAEGRGSTVEGRSMAWGCTHRWTAVQRDKQQARWTGMQAMQQRTSLIQQQQQQSRQRSRS